METIYLKRKIDDFLLKWKADNDRKPLIVKGCRQIGKTESIRHFAKVAGYDSFIEIKTAILELSATLLKMKSIKKSSLTDIPLRRL